jgi:hypothetical protein
VLPSLLAAGECASLARLFDDDARFRSTVDMARHRFGEGRYRYFAAPLPPLVADAPDGALRAPRADREPLERRAPPPARFPRTLAAYQRLCAAAASAGRRRCSSATRPAAGTRSIRTSTASSCFRCR